MVGDFGRFHHTLLGRMLLLVVLPAAVILAIVVSLAVQRGFSNLRRASEFELASAAALAAQEIETANRDAVTSAERMAEAQVVGMFGDREMSLAYARLVLEHSPAFTGAYFGYEPNADGADRNSLGVMPPAAMDPAGRFIPYWFRDPAAGGRITLAPLVDMETSLYYQGAKEAFERTGVATALVTEPYVYEGKMIVEQVRPIVIDGVFVGVAGVDRALSDIEMSLRDFGERNNVDVFLLSSRGKFIAATTDSVDDAAARTRLKTTMVADTVYAGMLGRIAETARTHDVSLEVDPLDGETYYYAAADVPTGDWTLVISRPESDVVAPIFAQLRFGIGIVVIGMAVIGVLIVISMLRVGRRVRTAATVAGRVAEGDLSTAIEASTSDDETGALLRALRAMTDNLNELVGGVKQASIQINSTATQLAATSRQQESVVSGFGSSASQIAAAVKEISATGGELVQTMGAVSRSATETSSLATQGRSDLLGMEKTMRGLDEATVSIGDKLATINDKAANITGVVTTITKVADQTNLLSVNAAIEAEKAGEYGVGFLVVAREIRRLADQTAAATLNIEQMVQEMQSAVSAGVMEMDRFADQVRHSVSDVARVSQQLGQIIEGVAASTASFDRVKEGMQSQSQGADQISEAMVQLAEGAEQTMLATREYGRAAADLQTAIVALKSSVAMFHLGSRAP